MFCAWDGVSSYDYQNEKGRWTSGPIWRGTPEEGLEPPTR